MVYKRFQFRSSRVSIHSHWEYTLYPAQPFTSPRFVPPAFPPLPQAPHPGPSNSSALLDILQVQFTTTVATSSLGV